MVDVHLSDQLFSRQTTLLPQIRNFAVTKCQQDNLLFYGKRCGLRFDPN